MSVDGCGSGGGGGMPGVRGESGSRRADGFGFGLSSFQRPERSGLPWASGAAVPTPGAAFPTTTVDASLHTSTIPFEVASAFHLPGFGIGFLFTFATNSSHVGSRWWGRGGTLLVRVVLEGGAGILGSRGDSVGGRTDHHIATRATLTTASFIHMIFPVCAGSMAEFGWNTPPKSSD